MQTKIMSESNIYMKKGNDESGRTQEEANVTPHESSQDKGYVDGTKGETASLKRTREANDAAASDSSLDDHNDGVPSTDTSATVGGGGGDTSGMSDQMRLEERRAYNRRNAARSRQRVKDQLRDLQQQVIAHTTSKSEMERSNVRLLAENNVLRDEVHKLRTILSGAPLFGQQQQTLQPFLQQPYGFGANTQFLNQGVSQQQPTNKAFPTLSESTSQPPTSQMMLPNASTQQQPFSFFPSSTQNQVPQQEPSSNTPSFANQAGDGSNNQSAVVQLLLQQIMSNNNASVTHQQNGTGTLEPTLQQQMPQPPQQVPPQQDNSFAAFMAFVGGGANASAPSATELKSLESQQQSLLSSLSSDGHQPSSTQTGFALLQQQQFDQHNVSELQQSYLSQQQQQQQQESYSIKEDGNTNV